MRPLIFPQNNPNSDSAECIQKSAESRTNDSSEGTQNKANSTNNNNTAMPINIVKPSLSLKSKPSNASRPDRQMEPEPQPEDIKFSMHQVYSAVVLGHPLNMAPKCSKDKALQAAAKHQLACLTALHNVSQWKDKQFYSTSLLLALDAQDR